MRESLFTDSLTAGTPGWYPPEQTMFVEPTSRRPTDTGKLGDASNVWAIGAIIMRVMNADRNPDQPRYESPVKGQMEPQLTVGARSFYSKYLCDLVDKCVRFRTYHQMELPDLWDDIERYTGRGAAEYHPEIDGEDEKGVRRLKHAIYRQKCGDGDDDDDGDDGDGDDDKDDNDCNLVYPEEKYKIGMASNGGKEQGGGDLDGNNGSDDGLGGEDPQGAILGGMNINEMLSDDDGLGGVGGLGVGGGLFPGDGGYRHIDEDYDDEEEDEDN
jgi:serine/threonine protein kinase